MSQVVFETAKVKILAREYLRLAQNMNGKDDVLTKFEQKFGEINKMNIEAIKNKLAETEPQIAENFLQNVQRKLKPLTSSTVSSTKTSSFFGQEAQKQKIQEFAQRYSKIYDIADDKTRFFAIESFFMDLREVANKTASSKFFIEKVKSTIIDKLRSQHLTASMIESNFNTYLKNSISKSPQLLSHIK